MAKEAWRFQDLKMSHRKLGSGLLLAGNFFGVLSFVSFLVPFLIPFLVPFFVSLFVSSVISSAANAELSYRETFQIRSDFCSKQVERIEQARARLDKELEKDPTNIDAYMLRFASVPGEQDVLAAKYLEKIRQKENLAAPTDRLLAAWASFYDRNADMESIRRYLNFETKDRRLESWRLQLLSRVEWFEDHKKEYLHLMYKSLTTATHFKPLLFAHFLRNLMNYPAEIRKTPVENFFSKIYDLDVKDPFRPYAEAALGSWEKNLNDRSIFVKYSDAYNACPTNTDFIMSYAGQLGKRREFAKEYKIYKDFIETHKFYLPGVDFDLYRAAWNSNHLEEARRYLNMAKNSYEANLVSVSNSLNKDDKNLNMVMSNRKGTFIKIGLGAGGAVHSTYHRHVLFDQKYSKA